MDVIAAAREAAIAQIRREQLAAEDDGVIEGLDETSGGVVLGAIPFHFNDLLRLREVVRRPQKTQSRPGRRARARQSRAPNTRRAVLLKGYTLRNN